MRTTFEPHGDMHMRAHGGGHDPTNFRPMCSAHDRYLAELSAKSR
jgi:hypothetical protein